MKITLFKQDNNISYTIKVNIPVITKEYAKEIKECVINNYYEYNFTNLGLWLREKDYNNLSKDVYNFDISFNDVMKVYNEIELILTK